MFDILFGWRKASKCKKLIRQIQCRLKLLKNKRCSIVRQLRDDVAQLLKHGHEQSAFDRAEQLFKDESIIAVYDLLDQFCEFIIINLPYIRKHRDCPNDVNEAVSTLIFASARCGDLPELLLIRKLFGERYGQRFAMVAIELLPGNLVNRQIRDNLSIKSVPNDVKYRLVDEIARSCLQPGPLALEYYSELHREEQCLKNMGDRVLKNGVQTKHSRNEDSPVQAFNTVEAEANVVYVDLSADGKLFLIEPLHSQKSPDSSGGSIHSANSVEFRMQRKEEEGRVKNPTHLNSPREFRIPGRHNTTESSSENSSQLPKEMIYLDDIAEFKSPMNKGENTLDQRLFMFKSPVIDLPTDELDIKKNELRNQKAGLRRGRRSRELSGIRQRTSVNDVESAIYYGECTLKSHHQRKHRKKIQSDESLKPKKNSSSKSKIVHECSLENPCYFFTGDDDDWESQKKRVTNLEGKGTKASYTRAMTMLPERLSDCCVAEKILRAKSFPAAQQPSHLSNGSPTCRHVHPKLPDYDQIAAKFMALKKANPDCKTRLS